MTEYPVRATGTSARVVRALLDLDGAGVTELARHLDLSKSAVHNHLVTLERLEVVVKEDGTYRLGLRFLDLGVRVRDRLPLVVAARATVRDLAADTGVVASAVVPEHGRAVYAYAVGSTDPEIPVRDGLRAPLHACAPGKAMLAFRPDEAVGRYVEERGLPRRTPDTVTDEATLRRQLGTVRDQGLAFDRGELSRGMRAVAAPVTDDAGRAVGAISVAGPAERMVGKRLEEDYAGLVLSGANAVALDLAR
ncbi:IclR family transcriptional regulator [Halomarina pelagica]|uniref:IclR family transcriptional regulator n=1 Tax=Halomarina pelagica TaxID=2961599 RepID=UPI0020C33F85|nr:IclR family transcriptional regulator [Halomarina sp. BND7]